MSTYTVTNHVWTCDTCGVVMTLRDRREPPGWQTGPWDAVGKRYGDNCAECHRVRVSGQTRARRAG